MNQHEQSQHESGVRYSSKVMAALSRFAGGLSTSVRNPLEEKYGRAYDYLVSADACRFNEDIDQAMAKYKQALELREDFTEAYIGMGKCSRRQGDSIAAIRYFQQALGRNPFNRDVHLEIAKAYHEAGYIKKSVHHYERAIQLDPAHVESKFGLALILELNHELDYAVKLYQEIIVQDEEFLPAFNNLGSVYLRLGRLTEAEDTFRLLLEKAPDFGRAYLGLALTLDKAGKNRQALDTYLKILEIPGSTRNVDYVKKRIIALNKTMGRTVTRRNTTLVRVK